MNAIVAKLDALPWPAAIREEREELPGFWTFRVAGVGCSAHRFGTAVIAGAPRRLWLLHAPRAVLRGLRDAGLFVRTLKEIAAGAGDHLAARTAWKHWVVNGTLMTDDGPVSVTAYPWTFAGAPAVGVDGAMTVSVLVRPYCGELVLGDGEDYDGAEAAL